MCGTLRTARRATRSSSPSLRGGIPELPSKHCATQQQRGDRLLARALPIQLRACRSSHSSRSRRFFSSSARTRLPAWFVANESSPMRVARSMYVIETRRSPRVSAGLVSSRHSSAGGYPCSRMSWRSEAEASRRSRAHAGRESWRRRAAGTSRAGAAQRSPRVSKASGVMPMPLVACCAAWRTYRSRSCLQIRLSSVRGLMPGNTRSSSRAAA